MSRRQVKIACGILLGAFACFSLGLSGGAAQQTKTPAVESLLPADSIVYIGWDGNAAHKQAWEQTAAYEALYKTGAMEVVQKLVAFLIQRGGDGGQVVRVAYDQIMEHGVSVAVNVAGDAGPPLPQVTVVLHNGAKLEAGLTDLVTKYHGKDVELTNRSVGSRKVTFFVIPNSPGVEIGWWSEGTHLVLTAGIKAIDGALAIADGKAPNLASSPLWKKYRQQKTDYEVSFVGWFDIGGLRNVYGNMPIPGPNSDQPLTVNRIAEALGLDAVGTYVARSGFKGKALWSETTLETNGPRKGLLALGEHKAITLADLPPLPADASSFAAVSFDWTKFYNDLVETARSAAKIGPPEVPVQLEYVLQQVPQQIGFNPKTDLFDPLGNVMCVYDDAQHGLFGFGFGVAIKVDDAATLRKTVNNLLGRLPPSKDFNLVRTKKHDRELISVQFTQAPIPVSPTMTIDNGWLVFGLQPQSAEAFLLRLDKKLNAWEPTPAHRDALAQLPKEFTSITVSDPRRTVPALLSAAPMLLTALQLALQEAKLIEKGTPLPITFADIPPAEQVTRPLFPNVAVSIADERGFHWISRTSLPGL